MSLEDSIYDLIKSIEKEKMDKNIFPSFALDIEVASGVKKALNNLYSKGRINVGNTVNNRWIETK